jgi:cell division protease FtsH
VERVTVIPQGQALGVTISLPSEDRFLVTRRDCLERLTMMLAGRAAEELFFSEQTSGAADDLARAGTLARRMVGEFGMGQPTTRQSLAAGEPDERAGAEREEREARALLEGAYERARALLGANQALVRTAAERLLEAEALDREEVRALLGARPEGARLVLAESGTLGGSPVLPIS